MAEERLFERIGSTENFKKYVKLLLNQYQIVDGYWFSYIEKQYGLDIALKMNEEIWSKIGTKTARDIKSMFKLEGKGVDKVLRALQLLPWYTITDYQVFMEGESVRIEIPHCLPQEIRKTKGMGEYPCRKMHTGILENFVKEIDDSVKVKCVFAPPDEHPKDLYCRWILEPK
ncbi:MAG: DUF6125 family protein [Promethearchaeati archaeon SRVP18_Atabeyarchaeia-1]